MSEINKIEQPSKINNIINDSSSKEAVFNSKLFLYLDSIYDYSSNNVYETELNDSNDINDINNEFFLIKELMEELDCPKINSIKEEHKDIPKHCNNSLISLINKGYEFIPKKYRNIDLKNYGSNKKSIVNNKSKTKNTNENKNCLNKNKNKKIKEKKGDWFCQFCHNLNFAFRIICNRCKTPKEECILKKNEI